MSAENKIEEERATDWKKSCYERSDYTVRTWRIIWAWERSVAPTADVDV